MRVVGTSLDGVKLLRMSMFGDERGWFAETWNEAALQRAGLPTRFVQDNQSFSRRGVLRGLHYQVGRPQGKLIRVLQGEIWDVAVDVRRGSANFGRWAGFRLRPIAEPGTAGDARAIEALWIPEGFAHGFLVMSEVAEVLYKVTDVYYPAGERTIRWNDPEIGVAWPVDALGGTDVVVSAKDADGLGLREAELPEL